jgi:hypothetical protein
MGRRVHSSQSPNRGPEPRSPHLQGRARQESRGRSPNVLWVLMGLKLNLISPCVPPENAGW